MGYHLLAVLLSPLALCLVAAAASACWPRRIVLWACLAPAWILAAMTWGLATHRSELAGPVLQWCRVDLAGLAVTTIILPAAALLWHSVHTPSSNAQPASPWRLALFQASLAPFGVVPLPCALAAALFLRPWSWRAKLAPHLLALLGVVALIAWPHGLWADAAAVAASAAFVGLARANTRPQSIVLGVTAVGAAFSLWRFVQQVAL